MAITESFRNAVSIGNVRSIRVMMSDSLLVDPTFSDFNEMDRLSRNVNGLYDIHDGRSFQTEKSAWNDDYMNKLMVQVVGNFSHERISHLKKVVRYLRPVAIHSQSSVLKNGQVQYDKPERPRYSSNRSYHEQKNEDERNNKVIDNRSAKIIAGAAVGGVVGGAGAVIVGGSFVVGVAVGGVVIGAVVAIATNGGQ